MNSKDAVKLAKVSIMSHLAKPDVGRTFGHLMAACGLSDGKATDDGLPHTRVLDRALQSLRKAGKVAFGRPFREWSIAETER